MEATIDSVRARAFEPPMAPRLGTSTERPGWQSPELEPRVGDGETLANALGWFSLGLGAVELLAPGRLAEWLGMDDREALVRAYGAREIATGIGILSQRKPTPWIWGRVAGDGLDLATLFAALPNNPKAKNVGIAIAAVAGVTALDVLCGIMLNRREDR